VTPPAALHHFPRESGWGPALRSVLRASERRRRRVPCREWRLRIVCSFVGVNGAGCRRVAGNRAEIFSPC
jgi:hypothetical protein